MPRTSALLTVLLVAVATAPAPARAEREAKAPAKKSRIQGATQIFSTARGLVAQGSGQLRILPRGRSKWQVVHRVPKGSLYRVAHDDSGRLMAWWEKEPHFHLFAPEKKLHRTIPLPQAPSDEFKYGYTPDDIYFTADGSGAIVYMHGFLGGRMWGTVAYHYDLERGSAPTLLFRQDGYTLKNSPRVAIFALPQNPKDACEHNSCHPLGAIIAWEIDGSSARKKVLLRGKPNNSFSRVVPVQGGDEERAAVVITEHPRGRHVLRWRWGWRKAHLKRLPAGPDYDTQTNFLSSDGALVEAWLTKERGLELRRHPLRGETEISHLQPLPRRTPNDRPPFWVSAAMERKNRDLILHWGEYLVLVPRQGDARRIDLRSLFKRKGEFAGTIIRVAAPEGFWIGRGAARTLDLVFLPFSDYLSRSSPAP